MSTFADQAVIAIETLRLFNEVQERTAETERTRKVMQTAFDNMGDGVALLDKDLRLQFMSQERIKSRQIAARLVHPGVPARELMLFQARRGDYGPVANEADVERKIDAALRADDDAGRHPLRAARGRPLHRVQLQADQRRRHPRGVPRHHRTDASARRRWPRPRRMSSAPAS